MRKPGSRPRNDYEDGWYMSGMGAASTLPVGGSHPKAVLWVPDPEQRHGWREFYVEPEAPPGRPAPGFRRA